MSQQHTALVYTQPEVSLPSMFSCVCVCFSFSFFLFCDSHLILRFISPDLAAKLVNVTCVVHQPFICAVGSRTSLLLCVKDRTTK